MQVPPRRRPALALVLALLLSGACDRAPEGPQEHVFTGPTMGTAFTVKVVAELDPEQEKAVAERISQRLEEVNGLMSTYLPDSELSRFNAHASTDLFPLSAETLEVLTLAQKISQASGGAFDVTVAPLVDAWGFGPRDTPPKPPSEEELAQLRQLVGYQTLVVEAGGARKENPLLTIDLNAIAKGYAVDRVALGLEELGLHRYMVEVGGEVRTAGLSARQQPWKIGIEKPQQGGHTVQRLIPLSDHSMATSGDYRNFYEVAGHRYSHTIDPRTGRPVDHKGASVSVVTPDCATADGWATALLVLGPEEGLRRAEAENLAAYFLVYEKDGGISEQMTPAFRHLVDTVE